MAKTAEQQLEAEYEAWCRANGLPLINADELIFEESLTAEQSTWLSGFIIRWDNAVNNEEVTD